MNLLEPNLGAKCDSQVIVGTVVEIDHIAELEAQADRSNVRFQTTSRIESSIQAGRPNSRDRTDQVTVRDQTGTKAEIREAAFQRDKWPEAAAGWLKLGAEEPFSYANRGALDGRDVSIGYIFEGFVKVNAIVVSELALEQHVFVNAIPETTANAEVVGTGLRDTQVIEKESDFDSFLCPRSRGQDCEQAQK